MIRLHDRSGTMQLSATGTLPFHTDCLTQLKSHTAKSTVLMSEPVAIARAPTPVSYSMAIQDLPVEQIHAELNRLYISEQKLQETNDQLLAEEFKDEEFAIEAVKENEGVIASYVWRREIIVYELRRRGFTLPEQGKKVVEEDSSAGVEL